MIGWALKSAAQKRRYYPRATSWFLSVYDAILRRTAFPIFPGRNRIVQVWLHDLPQPVYLRLGTSDWLVLWEIYIERVYDPLVNQCPREITTILDLGANIGLSVRLWLDRFPEALIVAVEPDPDNVAMLRRNVALSGQQERVRILQACVTGDPGQLYLERSDKPWAFRVNAQPTPRSIGVRAVTVDSVLTECDMSGDIGAIKCDIEGAERYVFDRCEQWIDRVNTFAIELHGSYRVGDLLADTRRCGRRLRVIHRGAGQGGDGLVILEDAKPGDRDRRSKTEICS